MGRRYYCDFCEKVFIDDIEARKKHLNCAHHQKLKKQHYDSFKDLSELLAEESVKAPCQKFQQTGYCKFETSCKYTHYTQEELWHIKEQIIYKNQEQVAKQCQYVHVPSPEEWLTKYMQQQSEKNESVAKVYWSYPQQLETRYDLPPSMKKFQPEYFQDSNFAEWGKSSKE